MRTTKKITTALATAGMLCGLGLSTALPASALPTSALPTSVAPADQPATQSARVSTAAEQPLTVDKSTVAPGEVVNIGLTDTGEGVNFVASEAFAHAPQNAFDERMGDAKIVHSGNGHTELIAEVADVKPGVYDIRTRVGGGSGPSIQITVR